MTGTTELRKARNQSAHLFLSVFLFSIFVNLLMLTGPIYMLQIYDRVLGSRSLETLTALTVLVGFLFAMMAVFDYARGRVIARAGARFQAMLDGRTFNATLRQSADRDSPRGATGLRDLESIQRLFTSPAPMTFFDIPWTPLFIAVIFMLHPWLGILALLGGTVLILLTLAHQFLTRQPVGQAQASTQRADRFADQVQLQAETIRSMGMGAEVRAIWQKMRSQALDQTVSASDRTGVFTTSTKALRLFLQSAMLGLGAYLVLLNQLTPGAMIAGSILLGRALAPIEQGIGQWPLVQAAQRGWHGLGKLLSETAPEAERTPLPRPKAHLKAEQITVMAPGENIPLLHGISFEVTPGQAMGVIGVSGSGKSTLARVLTGLIQPVSGTLRLDGATLDQYPPDVLGKYMGYVPQSVGLLEGTVAQNIARMESDADKNRIVEAAKAANAHDLILKFPDGYDTFLPEGIGRLSGGQMQRIALARALYNDPVVVVLDEPNSNLDAAGTAALNHAIRSLKAEGKAVVIMAHRPAAISECDVLLMLEDGQSRAFGPRDQVLAQVLEPGRRTAGTISPAVPRQSGGKA
ncbi:type I secretion system permease/ATPase [Rhabdonatronobacter sediminivivens]|nr:type I secretion system permease/ATPase [Rhabdonatronobacter sediminivivens]